MHNPHWKILDSSWPFVLNPTLGWIADIINGIPAGYDQNERIGRRINLKRLEFRGSIRRDYSGGGIFDPQLVRFGIIYDKQTNGGGVPVASEVWTEFALDRDTNYVYAMQDTNNRDRFIHLYDRVFKFNWCDTTAAVNETALDDPSEHFWTLDLDLEGLSTVYASTADSSIMDGSLFWYIAVTGPVSGTEFVFVPRFRLFYEDQ